RQGRRGGGERMNEQPEGPQPTFGGPAPLVGAPSRSGHSAPLNASAKTAADLAERDDERERSHAPGATPAGAGRADRPRPQRSNRHFAGARARWRAPETIFPNAMFPSAIPRRSNIARRSGCAPRERLRRLTLAKPARAVSMAE